MKIRHEGLNGASIDQARSARDISRVGIDSRQAGTTSGQVGLDRVDVSSVAETAARVLQVSGAQRQERVSELKSLYESGGLGGSAPQLANAIIQHDQSSDSDF